MVSYAIDGGRGQSTALHDSCDVFLLQGIGQRHAGRSPIRDDRSLVEAPL